MKKGKAFFLASGVIVGVALYLSLKRKVTTSLYLIESYSGSNKNAFSAKVRAISKRLGINPDWLMSVMHFESKINPKAKNPYSTATGLIQFMESTAQGLGTNTAALYNMSAIDQLDYVEAYLRPHSGKMNSFVNVYLAVFYPVAINWSNTKKFPNFVVNVNPVFVKNGVITKQTIINVLNERYSIPAGVFSIGDIKTNTAVKKQTVWFDPYEEKPFPDRGKFSQQIKDAKGKSGCYLIKEGSKVVYVGKSKTQLYKTITRHFQKWNDKQYRVSYDVWAGKYKVKILYSNHYKISDLECELYNKYNSRDNFNSPCFDFSDVPF